MSNKFSPFAELTGAERQIRWLEYQTIRLPYIDAGPDNEASKVCETPENKPPVKATQKNIPNEKTRPVPPPEVPRTFHADQLKPRHSHYDAVIARLKQAEIQAHNYSNIK